MSVDVFGRKLSKAVDARGPPGVGFRITADGQYGLQNKRMYNLAKPSQPNDAVTLEILQHTIAKKFNKLFTELTFLQTDLEQFKKEFKEQIESIETQVLDIQLNVTPMQNVDSLRELVSRDRDKSFTK